MKKVLALLLVLAVMGSALVGCGDKTVSTSTGDFTDVEFKVNEEALKVADSSDLPDWTGEQIELKMWYAAGSYSLKRNKVSENDVVSPEIQRVTGVKFSEESFDNNGDMMDAKIAKIIATDEWPDVIHGGQANVIDELIQQDMLWELTDLIPEYMPNLYSYMQKGDYMKSTRDDGKIYEINLSVPVDYAYPDMSPDLLARKTNVKANTGYVYVRDDILKQLKPEALTQDELIEIYEKNGKFTEEEILNAAFNSKEEFYQFLRDVKALGIKAGNRDVYATYAFAGSDNWDFMTVLAGALNGWNSYPTLGCNYFTYLDAESGKIEFMMEQPFFKETLKELTQLVREDVISQDSLIDNVAAYEEKCATGQYAILYGGTAPDITTLNANAQGYKYRKVIINIPFDTEKFVPLYDRFKGGYKWSFLKNQISAEELPQVLRFYDFMLTDVGQKLISWGPRSAGLFEETENGRRYTNKEVEDNAVYGVANDAQLYWGLGGQHWPGYPIGLNRWEPVYIYDTVPNIATMNNFFSTGTFETAEIVQSKSVAVYDNFQTYIPETKTFWDARTSIENALTRVLTATNDEEFETLYQNVLDLAERNGLTDETIEKMNDVWVNTINKDYIHNVEDFLKK